MASRRDELNAYSFARKRTNAAFLKPLPNGSIESAPRPLKAVLPSVLVGVLILVGFGACGILKPVAPKGWDAVGENVIVGDKSTTRYVVLNSKNPESGKNEKLLHPVLNLASAKLLLDPDKYKVVKVKESELDGKIPHGPAIGIPYAPDRLPGKEDAGAAKVWAVCDRPGSGANSKAQQAVFVLGGKDKKLVEGKGRVGLNQALYVRDPDGVRWLVDQRGFKFRLDATMDGHFKPPQGEEQANSDLRRAIFNDAEPQDVSKQWMDTLVKSPVPIYMPRVPGVGHTSHASGIPPKYTTIGTVLEVPDGQKYVVTAEGAQQVSDFIAKLLLRGQNAKDLHPNGEELQVQHVATSSVTPMQDQGRYVKFMGKVGSTDIDLPWPTEAVEMANNFDGSQTGSLTAPTDSGVSCSVYDGTATKLPGGADKALGYPSGIPNMQTWVGKDYPAKIAGGASAYVTPGSGLLYQEVNTPEQTTGSLFLVTDTGLRYSVRVNNDSAGKAGNAEEETNKAALRLGYKGVHAPPILKSWSSLLSAGPNLDVDSARHPQTS
ncbi:type VII secretion protein EccB [Streptomyces sp. NPDC048644]|uniref:type VII secretion protein EccB n=1 Tax=Streptomyces sp. NPDC048644 TaxID=3365582 RepID=UPI003723DB7B